MYCATFSPCDKISVAYSVLLLTSIQQNANIRASTKGGDKMKQLNVRIPQRLSEELDICCQLQMVTLREVVQASMIIFVNKTRTTQNLPSISLDDLLEDKPKPTESTL